MIEDQAIEMGKHTQKAFDEEMAKPLTIGEKAIGTLVMIGPIVVGFGLPTLVLLNRMGGLGTGIAMFTLCPALYIVAFELVFSKFGAGGFSKKRKNRAADLPRTDIANRKSGERVVVDGIVAPGPRGTVEGELTGKATLWSEVSLSTYKPGQRGRTVDEFRTKTRSVPFVIRPIGAGGVPEEEVLVDPDGATLRAALHQTTAKLNGPGSPRVRKLLQTEMLLEPDEGAEATETSLIEGDRIVVIGFIRRSDDAYRGGVDVHGGSHRVCLVSSDDTDLVATGESLAEVIADHRPSRGLAIGGVVTLTIAVGGMLYDVISRVL